MPIIEKANILIVDDKPQNLISLEAVLEGPDINIVKANSGNEALSKILEDDFALVLLDVQMPDMDGFETAEYMRGNNRTCQIPIIFVTAISKEQKHIFKGYESGAVDYIFKPLDPDILINKVTIFIDLFRQRKIIERKNRELAEANKEILDQQKALVEEERLKVLLQMAGATAHELNKPLMMLLDSLEMFELVKDDQKKVLELIPKIQKAGETISNTVNKLQNVRFDVTVKHDSKTTIADNNQNIHILYVEDSDWHYDLLNAIFEKYEHIMLQRATSVEEAMSVVEQMGVDIILLEYYLPDGTGLDFLEKLKAENVDLPVIAITGKGDEKIASSFIKAGALDYLPKKELNKERLFAVINNTLEKFGLRKELDRSIQKMAEDSTLDQLTGLYNRRYMNSVLKREVDRVRRYDAMLGCLLLDLDHFKNVNDTYGHLCGDYVLKEVATLLMELKRNPDYLFRYGGEEFLYLIPQTDLQGTMKFAERMRKKCEEKEFIYKEDILKITMSIGISSFNKESVGHELILIEKADKALYEAKAAGRNCVKICE